MTNQHAAEGQQTDTAAPMLPAAPPARPPVETELTVPQAPRRWDVPMTQARSGAMVMAPTGIHEVVEMAQLMAKAGPAVPMHCRGRPGVCLAIAMRALNWGMNPFALAEDTYIASKNQDEGVVAYGAKSVAAAINTCRVLAERPIVTFEGAGDTRTCKVVGRFRTGEVREYRSPKFISITPKNSPLWRVDPDRQLHYWSIRAWAREWTPEIVLGVVTPDEVEDSGPAALPPGSRSVAASIAARPASVFDDDLPEEPEETPAPSEDDPIGVRFAHACAGAQSIEDLQGVRLDFDEEIKALFPPDLDKLKGIWELHEDRITGKIDPARVPEEVSIILSAMAVEG